jgi:hypothetical protein
MAQVVEFRSAGMALRAFLVCAGLGGVLVVGGSLFLGTIGLSRATRDQMESCVGPVSEGVLKALPIGVTLGQAITYFNDHHIRYVAFDGHGRSVSAPIRLKDLAAIGTPISIIMTEYLPQSSTSVVASSTNIELKFGSDQKLLQRICERAITGP